MNIAPVIHYWKESSANDWNVAQGLFQLKHYAHCLFFCHLSLEKIIKAVYVKRHKGHAPLSHDLVSLCQKSGIEMTPDQRDILETITTFNIQGRYADYKSEFHKTFNKRPVAQEFLAFTKQLRIWLEKHLTEK